jgi:tetratricopeptide (TPR) repeat protein
VIKRDPSFPQVYSARGDAYASREQYERALADYAKAAEVARSQRNAEEEVYALNRWADLLVDAAAYEEAVVALRRVIELSSEEKTGPDTLSLTYSSLGWAYENMHPVRAEESRQAYEQALALRPQDLWTRKGRANALRLQGRSEEAAKDYRSVVRALRRRGVNSRDDYSLLGWCLYCLREYRDAVDALRKAVEGDPSMLSTWFDLGLALLCAGEYEEGREHYQQALNRLRYVAPLKARGLLLVARDDLTEAITVEPRLDSRQEVAEIGEALEAAWEKAQGATAVLREPGKALEALPVASA